ncbi:MAG: NADH-quinone oxidoreductase subunit NuoH [Dehalococcoidia bacterium]|nr:NADH-quinone oxidoreductase subunit NuoH [Dehalococcoidia bacterium]MSQ16611.1 NADH-quinone oxidoreductase subunit NuoH [Dehalococcoidia bacterium]
MSCQLAAGNILYENPLLRWVYDIAGTVAPCWAAYLAAGLAFMLLLVNGVLIGTAILTWAERRILARFANRIGPNRWGPFGLLQPLADLIKLLTKESLTPRSADRIVFNLAPILMLMPALLVVAVVPFARNIALADLSIGVLYVLAISSLTILAIFMAGWASQNRFALFGAARGVAVLISYEVPVVLSLLGVVMLAGSMSLNDIVAAQAVPFFLVQPLAFFVFFTGVSAELNRTPFDVAEGESEIVAGYHTEYSGIKFAIMQAAEFGGTITASAVIVSLFLAGWAGPLAGYLGWLWFLLKLGAVLFVFIWVRATFPRLRTDQIMAFSWKFLLSLALINLVATALEVYFLRGDSRTLTTVDLWVMAGINLALAAVAIGAFGRLNRAQVQRVRPPLPVLAPAGAPAGKAV